MQFVPYIVVLSKGLSSILDIRYHFPQSFFVCSPIIEEVLFYHKIPL